MATPVINGVNAPADLTEGDGDVVIGPTTGGEILVTDTDNDSAPLTGAVTGVGGAVYSGGAVAGDLPDLSIGAISFADGGVVSDGTQHTIGWTYTPGSTDLDWLRGGETLTITYNATFNDTTATSAPSTLTVVINGVDDDPTVVVTDPASVAESDTTDAVTVTIADQVAITDPDEGDAATDYEASSLAFGSATGPVPSGGSIEGLFTLNTAAGTIQYDRASFNYLAAGESVVATFNFTSASGPDTGLAQTIDITITGEDDDPTVVVTDPAAVTENDTTDTVTVTIADQVAITDVDESDTQTDYETSSLAFGSATGPVPSGGSIAGLFTLDGAAGTIQYDRASFNYLAAGESVVATFNFTSASGPDTGLAQTIDVTINGENDDPDLVVGSTDTLELNETSETAGDAASGAFAETTNGTLSFSDVDQSDTHTVAVTLASAAPLGPHNAAALLGMLDITTTPIQQTGPDGTGGVVTFAFTGTENDFDWVADGEVETIEYMVTLTDVPTGATDTHTVSVQITGANDAPDIIVGTTDTLALTENADTAGDLAGGAFVDTGGGGPTLSGTLTFSDPDFSDSHTLTVEGVSVGGTGPTPPADLDILGLLDLTLTQTGADGTGGAIDYTFVGTENQFDYLDAGETAILTYTLRVTDSTTRLFDEHTVTVTVTGANDTPDAVADVVDISEDPSSVITAAVYAGNVLDNDSDGDENDNLTVIAAALGAGGALAGLPASIVGAQGTLVLGATGAFTYTYFNTDITTTVGETLVDVFRYQISDGNGGLDDATLTINVTDSNLDLTIVPADASPFLGQTGPDTIVGTALADTIHGRAGNDKISGGDEADEIWGGFGDQSAGSGDDELEGGAGDDEIRGEDGNDVIRGDDGDDVLRGDDGEDEIHGGLNEDEIRGGAGNDLIFGDGDGDQIWGDEDDDTIFGGSGDDLLVGGSGTLEAGTPPPSGNDWLFGEDGEDELYGEDGNDVLVGGTGADPVYAGGDGNDVIIFDGDSANDIAWGGADADIFVVRPDFGDDVIKDFIGAGPTPDKLNLSAVASSIGDITISEVTQPDNTVDLVITINGDPNGNSLTLELANPAALTDDLIFSALPTDITITEDETSEAAAVDDVVGTFSTTDADSSTFTYKLISNPGQLFAIDGSDLVVAKPLDFETTGSTIPITVWSFDEDYNYVEIDFTIRINNVVPSAPTDTDATADAVSEGASNGDTVGVTAFSTDVNGGDVEYFLSNDAGGRFTIDATTGVVTVADASLIDFETDTSHLITARARDSVGNSATTNFTIAVINVTGATIVGTTGADTITAIAAPAGQSSTTDEEDTVAALGGDDTVETGGGNDTIIAGSGAGTDDYDGGDEIDTISYASTTLGVTVDLGAGTATGTEIGSDTISNVENVTGGSGDDDITGDDEDNIIYAGAGDDTVDGGKGNDTIIGGSGLGTDDYDGGDDEDTLSYASTTAGVTVNLGSGTASGTEIDNDTISNVENVVGGSGNDHLTGDAGPNTLDGGAGEDTIIGATNGNAAGADVLIGGADADHIHADPSDTVLAGSGSDTLTIRAGAGATGPGNAGMTILVDNANADVESVYGGPNDDVIDGRGVTNGERLYLRGSGGEDTIYGGNYRDNIWGGNDDDTLYGGDENDIIRGEDGEDTIYGEKGEDQLFGRNDNDELHGGDDDDVLDGGDGVDYVYGDAGNDRIYGASETDAEGADFLFGGDNDDKIYADSSDTINGGDGHDQLVSRIDGLNVDLAAASIEETWGGSDSDIFDGSGVTTETLRLRGGGGADQLTGGALNDRLYGGADGDTLKGGGGADYLKGEGGIDDLQGEAGEDTLRGGAEGDTLSGGTENDHLDGNEGADTLNGDEGDDTLVGALVGDAQGADILNGGDNNDRIYADGSDTVDGGSGVDTLIIRDTSGVNFLLDDANADVEDVWGDEGNDVFDGTSVTGEVLTLRGAGGLDTLTGGDQGDSLYGGDDADELFGLAGADSLSGEGGADTLTGGLGADLFLYTNAFDVADTVKDYSSIDGDSVTGLSYQVVGLDTHVYDGAGQTGNVLFILENFDADSLGGVTFIV